jgi:hypothetical protein
MSTATTDRPEQQAPPKPQRNAKGRFIRNNDGGPGNPFGRRVAELRKVLLRSATEENVERLATMLMEKAFAGDLAAAKLLLLYWIGKPKEVAEPDRVDVEEWELARQTVVRPDVAQETFASLPITIGIASLPGIAEVREREFKDMLLHPENYQDREDELTPEELAEEAEMIREMRAAREEAETGRPAAAAMTPVPPRAARETSAPGAACSSHSQADEAVAFSPPLRVEADGAGGSPLPNGRAGSTARRGPAGMDPFGDAKKRVG